MTRDPNDAKHLVTPYGDLGGNTSCFPAGQAHAGYSGNRQIVFFTLVATDQKRFIDWQTHPKVDLQYNPWTLAEIIKDKTFKRKVKSWATKNKHNQDRHFR
jgi:hypothetical protein